MLEITLEKANKVYNDIISGKTPIDEETYLFE